MDALVGNISLTLPLERRRAAHHVAHVERSGADLRRGGRRPGRSDAAGTGMIVDRQRRGTVPLVSHGLDLIAIIPLSSLRLRVDHCLSATGEGEARRTSIADHNGLDKRFGNLPVSSPFDDEVRPGSSARILSRHEGLY